MESDHQNDSGSPMPRSAADEWTISTRSCEIPEAVWLALAVIRLALGTLAQIKCSYWRAVRLLAKIPQLVSPEDEISSLPVLRGKQTTIQY